MQFEVIEITKPSNFKPRRRKQGCNLAAAMQLWLAVLAVRIIHSIQDTKLLKEKMYVKFNPLQLYLPLSHCNLVKDFLEANKIETPYQKVTNF